jgi:hypothetical protein
LPPLFASVLWIRVYFVAALVAAIVALRGMLPGAISQASPLNISKEAIVSDTATRRMKIAKNT